MGSLVKTLSEYCRGWVGQHAAFTNRAILLRNTALIAVDLCAIALAYVGAYYIRLDMDELAGYGEALRTFAPIVISTTIAVFLANGLYAQSWRSAGLKSTSALIRAVVLGCVVSTTFTYLNGHQPLPPRSVPIIYMMLLFCLAGLVRFVWYLINNWHFFVLQSEGKPAIIFGANEAGQLFARHLLANPEAKFFPVGYIDDDKKKHGLVIGGLPVLGGTADTAKIVKKSGADTGIICLKDPHSAEVRRLAGVMQHAGLDTLVMPDLIDLTENGSYEPRPVNLQDLIKRPPLRRKTDQLENLLQDHCIMITGAGGSIGSELVRQVTAYAPAKVILVEACEYNLYKILDEVQGKPGITIVPVLGSVTDRHLVREAMREHKPYCIFHAAAYKHVPIVEENPAVGVTNNVYGTKILAECAIEFGVRHFVLISTDKAVRPGNVMGASKRCCELLMQAFNDSTKVCRFSSVRFGNVLGSSGSVVPKFLEQIRAGGPVTVTHKDITRYFMLTEEAVNLILHAGTIASGGEIFVLDMGQPVRIYDLAKQLIALTGNSGRGIDIEVTGLRQGEKLYEELFIDGVEEQTLIQDIFVSKAKRLSRLYIFESINEILALATSGQTAVMLEKLWQFVTFDFEQESAARSAQSEPIINKEASLGIGNTSLSDATL